MVMFSYFLMTLLMFSGLFLIGLVLLQRGRGGGLAGAFGGMGGQSAFGTKAGDVFTRITIGVATAWILLCAGSVVALHHASTGRTDASLFKDEKAETIKAGDVIKAEPKDSTPGDDPVIDAGKDQPKAPVVTPEGAKTSDEKKAEDKPADAKPAEEAKPAEPAKPTEEVKPGEAAKPDAPPADEKKPEAPKVEEKAADPAPEPTPEKKPE